MNFENPDKLPLWAEFTPVADSPTEVSPRSDFHLNATHALDADHADYATDSGTAAVAESLDTADLPANGGVLIEDTTIDFQTTVNSIATIDISETLQKVLLNGSLFKGLFTTPQFDSASLIDDGTTYYSFKTFIMGSYLGVTMLKSSDNYQYASFWNGSTWTTPHQCSNVAGGTVAACESANYVWFAYIRASDGYPLVAYAAKGTYPILSYSVLHSYACGYIEMVRYANEVYIIYKKHSDNKTYYRKIAEGGAWGSETLITATDCNWKAAVVYGSALYLFYKKAGSDLYYSKLSGGSWSEAVFDTRVYNYYTIGATVYKNKIYVTAVSNTGVNTRPVWYEFDGSTVTEKNLGCGAAVQPYYIDCETYNNELYFISTHPSNTALTGYVFALRLREAQYTPPFSGLGIESSGSNNYGLWFKFGGGLIIQIAKTPILSTAFSASGSIYASSSPVTVNLPYPMKSKNFFHWDSVVQTGGADACWASESDLVSRTVSSFSVYIWAAASGSRYLGVTSLVVGFEE